ncbi:SulP family inorganic anion transporter [Phyllobacterium meliloti]|uniref:SulP family inorganic anion transporter n=1 Tax=Phyllobacterium meliloti TaxID=555317 RepID=UPI001D155D22|nr:SulP family inorganic anion transporter [Phyllobacterium sp. T1293]UGX86857.1 SulP family inorganic anion transporter [Phyllobacterium sp. T1293]
MEPARAFQTITKGRNWLPFRSIAGWKPSDINGDVIAGLTLAAIAIPEQMATARLGGFAPEIGFFAFIAGSLAFAIFGASRHLSAGADSTITPIFAGSLALLAASGSPEFGLLAAALGLIVGLIVVASGVFRLGWIADLLSVPVTTGFLAGISVHIIISQLPGLLGIAAQSGDVFQRISATIASAPQINLYSVALGAGVFLIVFLAERINARIPGALLGLVLSTLAVVLFNLESRGVSVLGALPNSLPQISVPKVGFEELRNLLPLALLVAVVVMVQTAATTRSFVSKDGEPPDVNRDFIGVGAGSILSGLFGAFPVNASPPRTAIVAETGGRSQVSGLIAAAIVLALVAFGGQLLARVPHAALAGILLFVAQRIIRWQIIGAVYREARGEFALILITMAAIVALPIESGVTIGIGLSLLHGLWAVMRARPIEFEKVPGSSIWWPPSAAKGGEKIPGVLVVAFQAPLSFVNADDFKRGLCGTIDANRAELNLVVLEASSIIEIDYTASQALADVINYCRTAGVKFAIARLESVRAQNALSRFGLIALIGSDNIFHSVDDAIRKLAPSAEE